MHDLQLRCPKQGTCRQNCAARVKTSADKVEVLFVMDIVNNQSTEFVDKLMQTKFKGKNYAYSYTQRYRGKKSDDCVQAFHNDVKRLKPDVLVFLGDRGLRYLLDVKVSEYENRGTFYEIDTNGRKLSGILTIHPSYFNVDPNTASMVSDDIFRAINPKLRTLRLQDQKSYSILKTIPEVKDFFNYLKHETKEKTCGLDSETINLYKKYGNKILTLQFSPDGVNSYILPWAHKESPWDVHDQKKIKGLVTDLFTSETEVKGWVFHTARFDLHQIYAEFGVMPSQVCLDIACGMWLINENRLNTSNFKLDTIVKEFGGDKYGGDEEIERLRSEGKLAEAKLKNLSRYGGRDACYTKQIYEFQKIIAQEMNYGAKWSKLMRYFYAPVAKMFTSMEDNGAPVDIAQIRYLKTPNSPLIKRMREIETEYMNLPSVKKVSKILIGQTAAANMKPLFGAEPVVFDLSKIEHKKILFWEVLNLDPVEFGKPDRRTGNIHCQHDLQLNKKEKVQECKKCGAIAYGKFDKQFQEEYASVKEVALLTEHSKLKKLITSYVDSLYGFVDPQHGSIDCNTDCRLRPNQNVIGTVTGRTSTTEPNLAQIPKARGGAATAIKNLFISEPGKVLIQIDGKTMEVRGLGLVAKDKKLAEIYNGAWELKGQFLANPTKEIKEKYELQEDIHKFNGAEAFDTTPKAITKEERDAAKGVTFGLIYGMGTGTLAGNLGKTKKETQVIVDKILGNMPDAKKWISKVHTNVERNLYCEDPMGVRRNLATFLTEHDWAKAQSQRQSVNSIIQGFCARIMMLLACHIDEYIHEKGILKKVKVINFVHDAIVLEVDAKHADKVIRLVQKKLKETMAYVTQHFGFEFIFPLDLDFEVGTKLGELKKLDGTEKHYSQVMKDLGYKDVAREMRA